MLQMLELRREKIYKKEHEIVFGQINWFKMERCFSGIVHK